MYILYDVIFLVFAVAYIPYLIVTRRYHSRLIERLGIFSKTFFNSLKDKQIIWLHAVSVGEVMAASSFIKKFGARFPDYKLLISTVTKTGNSIAAGIKSQEDVLIYFPLDLSFVINKILNRLRVRVFVIMETEIWPNIITAFYKKKVPIVLVNGRLSGRSFKAYKRVIFLLKGIFNKVTLFCMRSETDAVRLEALGIRHGKIRVTGNMKYDVAGLDAERGPANLRASLGIGEDKKIFIAGSTHRGEDAVILDTYRRLLGEFHGLVLLLAPRHIERVDEIERLVRKAGLEGARFSSTKQEGGAAQVIILDVMGKLKELFSISDIVFMAGSLFPFYGGHNLLEPAVFKKPILFGPHMSNFKDMAEEFSQAHAAIQVRSAGEIEAICRDLLNSPSKRDTMGKNAYRIIEKNRGATERNIQLIESALKGAGMNPAPHGGAG